MDSESCETGYREGENSREADEPVPYGTLCHLHGKTGYKTRRRALDAMRQMNRRNEYLKTRAVSQGKPASPVTEIRRVYCDRACRMWHLTSKKR